MGTAKKPNWIPAELCEIEPGNVFRGKLSDKETAQMIRYACNPPKVNAEAIINRGLPSLGIVNPAQSPIPGFGVQIDNKLADIPGRELPPPGLSYKVGQARPRDGSWNILDVKFHRGAIVSSWWVLVVQDGRKTIQGPQDQNLIGLIQGFSTKLSNSGITIPPGRPVLLPPAVLPNPHTDPERTNALNTIRQTLRTALSTYKTKPSFILVLLENRDNYIYPGIKVVATHFVDVTSLTTSSMNSELVTSNWVSIPFTCSSKRLSDLRTSRISISRTLR